MCVLFMVNGHGMPTIPTRRSPNSSIPSLPDRHLRAAGVEQDNIYEDRASGGRDDRSGLAACLKSLRDGDVLVSGSSTASGGHLPTWSTR